MSEYFDKNDLFLESKTTQYGSHMVMTNVSKPNKTKFINIDTKFRDEYNYLQTTNYNITLPERITEVKTMTVTSLEIPMTFYNISSSLGNNSFKIYYSGVLNTPIDDREHLIVIPDGQYTQSSLADAINNQFNKLIVFTGNTEPSDADLRYYNSNNYSYFYTNTSDFIIDFTYNDQGIPDKYNFKSKLGWLLGFRKPTYAVKFAYSDNPAPGLAPDGQTLTVSEFTIDLTGPRYLYLAIEEFNKGNQHSFISPIASSFINKNIVARISLDMASHGYGTVLPVNKLNGLLISDVRSYTGKIDLLKLNVQLLSDIGNPISLNGYDFSFCLEVSHE